MASIGGFAPIIEEDASRAPREALSGAGAPVEKKTDGVAREAVAAAATAGSRPSLHADGSADSPSTIGMGSPASSRTSPGSLRASVLSFGEAAEAEPEEDGMPSELATAIAEAASPSPDMRKVYRGLTVIRSSAQADRPGLAKIYRAGLDTILRRTKTPGAAEITESPKTVAEHDAAFADRETRKARALSSIYLALQPLGSGMPPVDATHLVTVDLRHGIGGCHWVADPSSARSPIVPGTMREHRTSGIYVAKVGAAGSSVSKMSTFFPTSFTTEEELLSAYSDAKVVAERGKLRILHLDDGSADGVYAQAFSRTKHISEKSVYPLFHVQAFEPGKVVRVPIRDSRGDRSYTFTAAMIPELVARSVEREVPGKESYFVTDRKAGNEELLVEISGAQGRYIMGGVWLRVKLKDVSTSIATRVRTVLAGGAASRASPASSGGSSGRRSAPPSGAARGSSGRRAGAAQSGRRSVPAGGGGGRAHRT